MAAISFPTTQPNRVVSSDSPLWVVRPDKWFALGSSVTGVLTSCNRYDLLKRTLDSFFATNTLALRELIVVEDGGTVPANLQRRYPGKIQWLSTGRRVGQIAAIDYAYSRVQTPYIFHLEDDWEFYCAGFIEQSMAILERHPKCLQVWIRALDDTNGHPVLSRLYRVNYVHWRKMAFDYGTWHGFSFNPGLRRMKDYVAIGGYGRCCSFDFRKSLQSEAAISVWYKNHGYFAAILCSGDVSGYIRHIGWDSHVGPPVKANISAAKNTQR